MPCHVQRKVHNTRRTRWTSFSLARTSSTVCSPSKTSGYPSLAERGLAYGRYQQHSPLCSPSKTSGYPSLSDSERRPAAYYCCYSLSSSQLLISDWEREGGRGGGQNHNEGIPGPFPFTHPGKRDFSLSRVSRLIT